MVGKRAKILSANHVEDLLFFAAQTRHPLRNEVLVLLSLKAGLRAAEIANLTWQMVLDPSGEIGNCLELHDRAAKKASGRVIPIHSDLRAGLVDLARLAPTLDGPVIASERGGPMSPVSIVCWFAKAFRTIGLEGCSSHSGRRTPGPPGWFTRPEAPFATFSCWLGIGRSRLPSATSMAIPKPNAGSFR